jgi:glycosyltransferase involved in cell wall biosynthesis
MSTVGCSVSIVISTVNRADLLDAAIGSNWARNAGGTPYELIIVDNNSTDDTAEVVPAPL